MTTLPTPTNPAANSAAPHRAVPTTQVPPELTTGATSDEAGGTTPPRRRGRRAAKAVALGLGIAAVAGGAYVVLATDDAADPAATEEVTLRTTTVEQRDLVEFSTLDGSLQYRSSQSVGAATTGTLTEIVDAGTTLQRGDELFKIDGQPTTLFFGDTPMYRTLSEGAEGDDVRMVEGNLASLGYHVDTDSEGDEIDTGFTVDGIYDSATSAAVLRWQAATDQIETGTVTQASIVVAPGEAIVSTTTASPGSPVQLGAPLLNIDIETDVEAVYSEHTGELELVATGAINSGDVLYVVDDQPVVAVVTDEAMKRDLFLGVEDGPDIEVIETMLVAQGYDADGDLDIDETFDEDTAVAVEEWKEDLADTYDDLVVDGTIRRSELIVIAPGATVAARSDIGDVAATGDELFTSGGGDAGRVIRTSIDVSEQTSVTLGSTFDVVFPDGSTVVGTVQDIARSTTVDPTDPNAEPQLAVELALAEVPASADGFVNLDVEVNIVDRQAVGATVVPAAALVATADGGFAVEVVNADSTTTYVGVSPGLFADGFVEVSGIEPGTTVVVPS